MNHTTASPLRCVASSGTSTTRSLLTVRLTTTTTNVCTLFYLVGTGTPFGKLVSNGRVKKVLFDLYTEYRLIQLYRTD
jgi:hypothetical protein